MNQTIIQEYTDFLKIEKQFTPNTLMAYRRGLTLFSDYCTDIGVKVTAITRENAVQYKEWLMQQIPGISVRTINHYIGIAEGLYVFCRNEEITDRNPFELVERAKPMKVVRDTITTDQALAIITAVDPESAYCRRDKAILQVLFATGVRVSELTDLIVSDYSPSDESILVRHGKGSKDRIVPIGRHTIALIDEYLATRDKKPDSPLFYNRFKERLTRKSVFMIVKASAYRAKIRGISVSPHTLRHSCATALLAGGADLLVIRDILGHSDITTTETYLHNTPVMLKKAMDLHPRAKKITKKRGRPKKNVA